MLKNKKGITLIALIITIIVLLILAGVALNAIAGENGILNQAKKANNKNDKEAIFELIQLLLLSALTEGEGKIDVGMLDDKLREYVGYTGDEITSLPKTITIEGENYTIQENGKILNEIENESEIITFIITNEFVRDSETGEFIFGEDGYATQTSVTYQAEEGMTWREWVNSKYNTGGYQMRIWNKYEQEWHDAEEILDQSGNYYLIAMYPEDFEYPEGENVPELNPFVLGDAKIYAISYSLTDSE